MQKIPIKKLLPAAVMLLTAAMMAGCTAQPLPGGMTRRRAGLSYTDGAFAADVRGSVTRTAPDGYTGDPARAGDSLTGQPQNFAATVTVTAPSGDGRRMEVTYTEPASLAGLTVTAETPPPAGDGTGTGGDAAARTRVTVALDDISATADLSATATDGRFDRLLLPALALLAEGDITETGRGAGGLRTVTVAAAGVRIVCGFTETSERPVLLRLEADSYGAELRVSWKEPGSVPDESAAP